MTDYMPPNAQGRTSNVVSGVQTLPTVATLSHPTDGAAVGICQVRSVMAKQRVLTIGAPITGIASLGVFPPYSQNVNTPSAKQAGLQDSLGSQLGGGAALHLACLLEYGAGSCLQRAVFDWAPGSYNIPPCEFARVSALPWGTSWPLNGYTALASIAEGEMQDAFPPLASGSGAFSAGIGQTFTVPALARAFEVLAADNTLTPVITLTGGINAKRNYATGLFMPGWSPLDAPLPGETFTITSDIAAVLTLQWRLQL